MVQAVPLELLHTGESARIAEIDGRHDMVVRLKEMGLQPGKMIRMVQPGSPCIIAIDNHRLSFRGDESAGIWVELEPATANVGKLAVAGGINQTELP